MSEVRIAKSRNQPARGSRSPTSNDLAAFSGNIQSPHRGNGWRSEVAKAGALVLPGVWMRGWYTRVGADGLPEGHGRDRLYFSGHSFHACGLARSCRDRDCPGFPSAVRAKAARCKLPFALRPGLSKEDVMRTKEITKERQRQSKGSRDPSSTDAMNESVEETWVAPLPRHPAPRPPPVSPQLLFPPLPELDEIDEYTCGSRLGASGRTRNPLLFLPLHQVRHRRHWVGGGGVCAVWWRQRSSQKAAAVKIEHICIFSP